jgi:hypothetical protein
MTQTINLGPEVYVTDPCYSVPTWCQIKLTNVLPGEWIVSMIYDEKGGSNRNAELYLVHKDYQGKNLLYDWDWLGDFGVDSGQAGVFDAASYRNDAYAAGITTPKLDFVYEYFQEGDIWYEKMCKFTLANDGWGAYAAGAVSSSGYGDGEYPVYGAEVDGKVVALQLVFIDQSADDDEDLEEDCCNECGAELEWDGSCDYCEHFKNSKLED